MKRRHFSATLTAGLAGLWCVRVAAAPAGSAPVVLIVGDSLSAEYGLRRGSGWVALLQARLQREGVRAQVVNASVSGDTTAGGRSRLPGLLQQHQPAVVVIELGGNDALRGLPLSTTRDNLRAMVRASRAAGARVLLLGMDMPPNYGERYRAEFRAVYADVAREEQAALVPFFLAGVADGPHAAALFQADRIHPNEDAQPAMLNNVWPQLRRLLVRG
ncbi:arylesterase [Tepidimonas ignava]|uniref:arylesterase n=1 Tax=Tepidimonas ignava TaxID=114249 RepID=UPI003A52277D